MTAPSFNTLTVSFILQAGCKIARCAYYKSVHLRMNRFRFKWNAFGCSSASSFRCDVCFKCSSLYPFQPTHKYFQHQGIFSTSHWWTAPIYLKKKKKRKKACIAKTTTLGFDSLHFKMLPVLLIDLLRLWKGEMTTSFLSITHGWLSCFFLFFFCRHTRSTGRTTNERERKCVQAVCMSRFCKIKLDLKLLLCHIPTQSALPEGPACPPGQSGALSAANVYAENTWTEFELPYDVGLFLAVMSCWQQGLPQTRTVSTKRSNTQIVAPATPHTFSTSFLSLSIISLIYISL